MPKIIEAGTMPTVNLVKIASIIDDYRVVINAGKNDGIAVGHRFLIYKIGKEIFDPDDPKKSLGHIEIIKGKGEVIHVQDRMATLQTTEKHEIQRKPSGLFAIAQAIEVTKEPKAFINPEVGDIARFIG